MTDKDLPDKVRKLAARFRQQMEPHTPAAECAVWKCAAEAVEALLPPRPTLADMTDEERSACKWMQADVGDEETRPVIINANWLNGSARVMWPTTRMEAVPWGSVTPRPDLPRMEWPGTDQEAEDETAVKIGDLIESAADPRAYALPDGSVLLDREGEATTKRNHSWRGAGYTPVPSQGAEFGPWTVVRIGQGDDQ